MLLNCKVVIFFAINNYSERAQRNLEMNLEEDLALY